jgi:prostaglandin-endoperoxide synthase 2
MAPTRDTTPHDLPGTNGATTNGSNWSIPFPGPLVRSAVSRVVSPVPVPRRTTRASRHVTPASAPRSTAKDGLGNQIETFLTTHGTPIWTLIQWAPPLRRAANKALTNAAILRFPTRPNPFSTMADYTSWESLIDRTFSGRHLPPTDVVDRGLPDIEEFERLFTRTEFIESPKSTVLFSYFAQWFTDGFLRSDRPSPGHRPDPRKNESNHDIDLTNLYGLHPDVTRQLRTLKGGLLKSRIINGEEYPPYLCRNGKRKPEFSLVQVLKFDELSVEQRNKLFAMGSDTSNLQVGFVMHNVLFLREHNRIARLLGEEYPDWDDERLFATTRNILTVLLMKIVVEDYVNHISPMLFKLRLDPSSFPNEPWYRQNWMAVEFDLLYRWHSLVPPSYQIRGQEVSIWDSLFNTEIVTSNGLGPLFEDASEQPAGQIGLGNTPEELWPVEAASIEQGRAVGLRSYNDYRELARLPRVTQFDQITSNVRVREELRRLYGHVDNIDSQLRMEDCDVCP